MDWITDDVAIGNHLEAQDTALLARSGIASVLGLIPTLSDCVPEEMGLQAVSVLPLEDGAGCDARVFLMAVKTLSWLVKNHRPVLVHCHAGRSRSAAVVAGYLMRAHKIDADEALARVAAKRFIAVTPAVERMLDYVEEME